MRVLHIVPCLDPVTGGPARSVPALCHALQAAGVDVVLYTFRRAGDAITVSANRESFPIRWFKPLLRTRELPTLSYYRCLRESVQTFDLVHLHSLWNPAISVAALACRQAGVPYILSPRGMLQKTALQRRHELKRIYYRFIERRTILGAHALHFFTRVEMQDSQSLINDNRPFIIMPNGVDPYLADGIVGGRFRNAYPVLKGKRIVLFLGRLHWSKGLDLQVQAISELAREFSDLIWVLVGPDEGEWKTLSGMIAHLNLGDQVFWTGSLPRERCLEALVDADVVLLTSRHEAHSMTMNEALAIGVPLVITDTVSFDEIGDRGAGSVVPCDPHVLAGSIAQILRNPSRADAMRQAGRKLASEYLAWPKVATMMKMGYERVLSGKNSRGQDNAKFGSVLAK